VDLLEAADEVTTSNDDAGVARVLERLFGAHAHDFVNRG
jgi:hydroxymethylpyrimidine pyrophosphatase-like HAD family hydrolase